MTWVILQNGEEYRIGHAEAEPLIRSLDDVGSHSWYELPVDDRVTRLTKKPGNFTVRWVPH
jgi:hypothetical protein